MFIVPMEGIKNIAGITEKISPAETALAKNEIPFKDVLSNAFRDLQETQKVSDHDAYMLAMGQTDDLHTVMINSQKAETALNMTVQLTSRALAAYNEVMRMQV
ncbi:MAG: flagellar hook-basal body complex protein FliE, partial [Oscillospiraceae bacterium]